MKIFWAPFENMGFWQPPTKTFGGGPPRLIKGKPGQKSKKKGVWGRPKKSSWLPKRGSPFFKMKTRPQNFFRGNCRGVFPPQSFFFWAVGGRKGKVGKIEERPKKKKKQPPEKTLPLHPPPKRKKIGQKKPKRGFFLLPGKKTGNFMFFFLMKNFPRSSLKFGPLFLKTSQRGEVTKNPVGGKFFWAFPLKNFLFFFCYWKTFKGQ